MQMEQQNCQATPDWAGLTSPLLQQIFRACLPVWPLPLRTYLLYGSEAAKAAEATHNALLRLSQVCRRWHAAVQSLLQQATWAVGVQVTAPLHRRNFWGRLRQLRIERLDVRKVPWVEGFRSHGLEELLVSPTFLQLSAPTLRHALGIPERLAASLAPFRLLECVGLCEDYASTQAKPHGAPMNLAPLAALPLLRRLQLELGIVDLAAIPSQVAELALVHVDRIQLPPAVGLSVTDRMLTTVELLGLSLLHLEAMSGAVVFEESGKHPLELDLPHVARLLQAANRPRWRVQLSTHLDDMVGWAFPQLELALDA